MRAAPASQARPSATMTESSRSGRSRSSSRRVREEYDRSVNSDRFDDVEFEILEAPEPAPRRRRRGLAFVGAVAVTVGLAAGASALASSDEPAAPQAPAKATKFEFRHHHGCHHGGRHHDRGGDQDQNLGLRY